VAGPASLKYLPTAQSFHGKAPMGGEAAAWRCAVKAVLEPIVVVCQSVAV
jgi:hypothetical protein